MIGRVKEKRVNEIHFHSELIRKTASFIIFCDDAKRHNGGKYGDKKSLYDRCHNSDLPFR